MTSPRRLELRVEHGTYAICRLPPGTPTPAWGMAGHFWTISGTTDELSIICEQSRVPAGARAERDFVLLKMTGPIDFSETGVIASVAGPLADAAISLVPIATFDTDYVLVRRSDHEKALAVLRAAGHTIREDSSPPGR